MAKLPLLTAKELAKILEKIGFVGSVENLVKGIGVGGVVFSQHP